MTPSTPTFSGSDAASLSVVVLPDGDTEVVISHLHDLTEHEMFSQLAVSLIDYTRAMDADRLAEALPWLPVSSPSNVPDLEAAVALAFDSATTRLVEFASGRIVHTALEWAVERGNILAERFDLLDAPFPLLYLTGWNDHRIIGAYRAWIDSRHSNDMAEWRTRLDNYLQMLPYRNLGANIHGIDIVNSGTTLRITGTARRGDTDGPEPPDHDVRLVLLDPDRNKLLTVDTRPELRMEGGKERWTGFTADLAIDSLPMGRTALDIHLTAPKGYDDAKMSVKITTGMLVASRPVVAGGRRFQVFPVHGSERAELVTRRSGGPVRRLLWGLTVMRRDLGAIVHRRRFAWVRVVRTLTRPFFLGRPIWLVGERPDTARDNGYHLFAHLARERPDIRAYYLMEESSTQFAQMSQLGPVVKHSSWRHRLLMHHTTALVNAYSIKHMVPRQWGAGSYARGFSWRIGSFRIYLKHGVHMNTKVIKRRVSGYDLFLTATAEETKGARQTSGYGPQIALTGLPRYDALIPTPPSRTVLFMPTWRIYFQPKLFSEETEAAVPFEASTYQVFMQEFFASSRLHDLLERHDYQLQFMPHYNMRQHLGDLHTDNERITVLDGAAANIQDVMRDCDLFLTDHSSVHFDIAYLGTPLIYSHFDNAEYRTMHALASWFDHEREGFGPVTYDLASTLDALEGYLSAGCVREELYDQRAKAAFAFHDRDNSARVVAATEELLRTGWTS